MVSWATVVSRAVLESSGCEGSCRISVVSLDLELGRYLDVLGVGRCAPGLKALKGFVRAGWNVG